MPKGSFSFSSTVGYISLDVARGLKSSDFINLQKSCREVIGEVDILAEEYPPGARRPLWDKLSMAVVANQVSTVIVPSLSHIAGNDIDKLSSFFNLAKASGVRVISIPENIDTLHKEQKFSKHLCNLKGRRH